tara:strand:+ start:603 stop:1064 length:462 start_codon:yes stop_codon:yes gene_type:complete
VSTIKVDTYLTRGGVSEIAIDKLKGVSSASSISVVAEGGSTTTNLQQGLAKCWLLVAADGASILDSLNVSSHDDDGTGDGGVHINNDMGSVNYVIQLTADDGGAGSSVNSIEVTNGTVAAGSFDYENNYVNSASDNRTAFNVIRHIAVLGDLA